MTDRQHQILETIIREYVKTAEPVSSGWLVDKCGFDCSPATLRAEMNALEEEGFLQQPHTSAGRIPTDQAYRLFVNQLLEDKKSELPVKERQAIDKTIANSSNAYHLSRNLANLLAQLTKEFAVSGIIDTDEFFKAGLGNMFNLPESRDFAWAFQFGNFFDEFENIYQDWLADLGMEPMIYVGDENPGQRINSESVVVTKYPLPNGQEGISAIIGPTRMRYGRNYAILEYINKKLSQ